MGGDSNKENQFSELIDKIVHGEEVSVSSEAGDELKETVDFAHNLMALSSEPSPAFQNKLEKTLIDKLAEREKAREAGRWWRFGPGRQWLSFAATAAVIILAVVGFFGYRSLSNQPVAPTSPSTAPTSPRTTTTPSTPGATAVPSQQPPAQSAPQPLVPPLKTGGSAQVEYAYSFNNLSDLTAFSDDIVIATVDKVVDVTRENGGYTTRWALQVNKTVSGPLMNQIVVSQVGSPDVPGSDSSEDPLFVPGEHYLLFLGESTQYFYYGPNGRYMIWDGGVFSMNHIVVNGGGYQPPPQLDFNGQALDNVVSNVTKIADSVQLIFTQGEAKLQADVLRYPAGTTLTVDARLLSGEHGPGGVTMSIDKSGIPAGLDVNLQPAQFVAYPQNTYKSTLTITISPDLPTGSYKIPVDYDFSGVVQGNRVITLNVDPR